MRAAGVSQDRAVVVYDDRDATAAARAWWLLRYFGHEHVRVLDGGYQAWLAVGLPVSTAGPAGPRGNFTARPGHMPVLDAAGAGSMARTGLLLDARAGERYRGEREPVDPVAGHIPGAVSAPTAGNVNPDGTFRTPAELRARFAALGAGPGPGPVGAYCGSGVTAAHEVLALALAGIPAALYVGSWSNWITDPARPVATGSLFGAQHPGHAAPAEPARLGGQRSHSQQQQRRRRRHTERDPVGPDRDGRARPGEHGQVQRRTDQRRQRQRTGRARRDRHHHGRQRLEQHQPGRLLMAHDRQPGQGQGPVRRPERHPEHEDEQPEPGGGGDGQRQDEAGAMLQRRTGQRRQCDGTERGACARHLPGDYRGHRRGAESGQAGETMS